MNCVGAGNIGVGVAFESAARFDYRPAAGSAQVDLVPVLPDVSEDLSGAPRPVDGDGDGTALSDAGAHEAGAGSPWGTIAGRAVDYADDTGARGVCVLAFGDKGTVRAGRTTTAGYYRIERLQPDTYRLLWRPCIGHSGAIWVGGNSFSTATGQVVAAGATVAVDFPAFTPAFIRLPSGDRSEEGFADHPGCASRRSRRPATSPSSSSSTSTAVRKQPTQRAGRQLPRVLLGLRPRPGPIRLPRGGMSASTSAADHLHGGRPNRTNGYSMSFVWARHIGEGQGPQRLRPEDGGRNGHRQQRLRTARPSTPGPAASYFLSGVAGGYSSLKIRFDGPAGLVQDPVVRQQDVTGNCRHLHGR